MAANHTAVVAALGKAQRQELLRKSDLAGLRHLVVHWGAIGLSGALIWNEVPYWPVLLVPQGILIAFLFTTLHETIHFTAFRTEALNRIAAAVSGFALLIGPRWFRYFHFDHHRFTNDPERDPELAKGKPATIGEYVVYLSGLHFWRAQVRTLLLTAAGAGRDPFVPEKARDGVKWEARAYLAAYAAAAGLSWVAGSDALLWTWIVPVLLGQPFLRAYLLAEHAGCPDSRDMFENSRTTFTNPLIRGLAWNMPYHAEHHAYPAVPFHRLPELHGLVSEHLRVTETGYASFHRKFAASFAQ